MNTISACDIVLDYEEQLQLESLANLIKADPTEEELLFCKESKEAAQSMPQRLRNIIENFINFGSKRGHLLIKCDLIEGDLPDTPPNNNSRIGETTILSKIQSMIVNYKSDIISYEAEGYGRLFQDVIPVKKMETEQTSVSSKIVLELHTEQAFSNLKPDILSLACLRGNPEAYTYVLPVGTILQNLSNEEIDLLYEKLWMIGVDLSFKLNGVEFIDGDLRGPISILNGSRSDPVLIFDQDLMKGITERSNELIQRIIDIYYKSRIEHSLKPGEIILIDNRRATHGRSSFTPMYNGKDRFLIRCFGTTDIKKSEHARSSNKRSIFAKFS
jgi:hypothetical protein